MTAQISIPSRMRAFAVDKFGQVGSLREVPTPTAGADEVLIKVAAAGINPLDLKIRDGAKQVSGISFPHVLGQDCSGIVVQKGYGVIAYDVGSEVFGALWLAGTFAEYVRASTLRASLSLRPCTLDHFQTAAIPTPALAARAALLSLKLKPGDTVLIVGATGSVGALAVQMASKLCSHVIATARSDKADGIRGFGAGEVIDHSHADVVSAVRAAHPDGVDAVLDVVSNTQELERIANVLRPGGRLTTTIHSADEEAFRHRGLSATNVDVFGVRGDLTAIGRQIDDEHLQVHIPARYPLSDAAEALEVVRSGQARGKVVLTME